MDHQKSYTLHRKRKASIDWRTIYQLFLHLSESRLRQGPVIHPLAKEEEMTIDEVLKSHPKGIDYAHLLEGMDKVPIIYDSNDAVLSSRQSSTETIQQSQQRPAIYSLMLLA